MKRPFGITISAVIAIVGSAFSVLLGLLMVVSAIMTRNTPMPPPSPDQPVPPIAPAIMVAFISMFYAGSGVWGAVSAIGLLRLRNWARICFAVFGGILCLLSGFGLLGSLAAMWFLPQTLPAGNNVPPGLITGMFVAFGAIALLCVALGIWWIIYFNRQKVTAHFLDEDAASAPRQFPLSITIIAWILISGGLFGLLGLLFMASPFLFLGFIIHGLAARLLYLLFVVLSVASGVGMLRRRVEAHALAVGYFAFALLNLFFYILTPSSFVRFMQEMPGGQNLPADTMHAFFLMGNVFGLLSTSLVLWFLITRRQRFIAACVG
jgi:hypothetical protein